MNYSGNKFKLVSKFLFFNDEIIYLNFRINFNNYFHFFKYIKNI